MSGKILFFFLFAIQGNEMKRYLFHFLTLLDIWILCLVLSKLPYNYLWAIIPIVFTFFYSVCFKFELLVNGKSNENTK